MIVHATDRTGPPIVLLRQLRWLVEATDWRFTVVALRGGDLRPDFEAVAEVRVLDEVEPSGDEPEERRLERWRSLLADLDPDLLYVNTAWSITALPAMPASRDRPMISAIHELDIDLRDTLRPSARADLLGRAHHIVAGAEVIAENLVHGHGVPADRITVVPEPIELPRPRTAGALDRASWDLAEGDFVVVAAGTPTWRKGPDLFVHLCHIAHQRRPDIPFRFRWLGADPKAGHADLVGAVEDARRFELGAMLEFSPPVDDVEDRLALADVFVLTSREDASPLVCLEAAAAHLPVVCFDNGGIPSILGRAACTTVPYPDLDAMADALIELSDDPDRRIAMGAAGRAVVEVDHDIDAVGPALHRVLAEWLPEQAG